MLMAVSCRSALATQAFAHLRGDALPDSRQAGPGVVLAQPLQPLRQVANMPGVGALEFPQFVPVNRHRYRQAGPGPSRIGRDGTGPPDIAQVVDEDLADAIPRACYRGEALGQ